LAGILLQCLKDLPIQSVDLDRHLAIPLWLEREQRLSPLHKTNVLIRKPIWPKTGKISYI